MNDTNTKIKIFLYLKMAVLLNIRKKIQIPWNTLLFTELLNIYKYISSVNLLYSTSFLINEYTNNAIDDCND